MSYFRYNFGGDKDLERRYVAALKRALDHTFRMKELEKGEPMNANELADLLNECIKDGSTDLVCVEQAATMLRQQQAEIETLKDQLHWLVQEPAKTLTDEEWNKAFDFYCETDEGVLKFDLELRDEWKKEQLIRWKEALRKAQEK